MTMLIFKRHINKTWLLYQSTHRNQITSYELTEML